MGKLTGRLGLSVVLLVALTACASLPAAPAATPNPPFAAATLQEALTQLGTQ